MQYIIMAKNKKSGTPHYELLYIIPNKYTEDDLDGINKRLFKLIEKHEGKITFKEDWGKKKFAYPINHELHGYYALVEFDLEAKKITQLNTELRMNHEILRHMIVNIIPKTPEQIAEEKKRLEKRVAKATENAKAPQIKKETKEKKKVDSKELDDKLDKILETDDLL